LHRKKAAAPTVKRARPAAARKRRSADDLMARIVEAARAEFKARGFGGATTAAIARRADVTEAQLFRYFGSKSTLFRETIFKPIDEHLLRFTQEHPHAQQGSRKEMNRLYTRELLRFIRENADMLKSLVVAQLYDAGTADGVGKIGSLAAYFDHAAAMMKARLKGKSKVPPELVVRLAFVFVLGSVLFRDWIFPSGLASDDEITAAVSDFLMAGVDAAATAR